MKHRTTFENLTDTALVREAYLIKEQIVPFAHATLWRKIRDKEFPVPTKISANVTAFRVGEIREWQKNPAAYRACKKTVHADE